MVVKKRAAAEERKGRSKKGDREEALVKMSVLARMSDTPPATLKHYIRERLIDAAVRTSRNMALYDPASLVPRIAKIKELQRTRFLPLRVIKEVLESGEAQSTLLSDETLAAAIRHVLDREGRSETRTRAQLIETGMMDEREIERLQSIGLLTPLIGPLTSVVGGGGGGGGGKNEERYGGDDLALLRVFSEARKAGLSEEMLPFSVLETYMRVLGDLVRSELSIFRARVLPRVTGRENLAKLAETAATLSERLIILLRRKLLLPTLHDLVVAKEDKKKRRSGRRGGARSARG